jgi:enterochelin esterase-like enzyme
MGLTSNWLLALMAAVGLGAIALTARIWPSLAPQRTADVLGRIGLVLLCQVTTIALALTAINDELTLMASWSDLVGSTATHQVWSPVPGHQDVVPAKAQVTITGASGGTSFGTTPLSLSVARALAEADVDPPPPEGAIVRIQIRGEYSGITSTPAYVYLPPQYFQRGYAHAAFPVVLVFAGYPNDPLNLMRLLHLPGIAARLTADGQIRPMVWVMVNPSVALPRDTECTNVPAGPQVATFFGRDVPLALQRTFRVQTGRSGWAAMGYSTGAYCAIKLAMLYPNQFAAAIALSGYFIAVRDLTTGNLYGDSLGYRNENNLDWRLTHLPAPPVSVLAASTDTGEETLPATLRFLHLIRPPMRGYSLILPQGGHNYFTWRRMLPQSLQWLSQRLSPAVPRR